jgi:hypothetical protein
VYSIQLYDTPLSSTNKTDRHDITEILLKVALSTINQTDTDCLQQAEKSCFDVTKLQIKKKSCQMLGPASKRVLPGLSTFCQTYFFFKKFFNISLSIQYD